MGAPQRMPYMQFPVGERPTEGRKPTEHLIIFAGGEMFAEPSSFSKSVGAHHLEFAGRIAGMEYIVRYNEEPVERRAEECIYPGMVLGPGLERYGQAEEFWALIKCRYRFFKKCFWLWNKHVSVDKYQKW